ncbi:uncharacterized protein BJX67DRAFT_382205 [Aspergillus lucknowensis]|uniref:Uncharacterized protein n=1 Tax=Aspergillus lucknowensis TaxID=176173 RepID=A0ABR4LNI9_9EURO
MADCNSGSESPTTIVYDDDLGRGFLGNLTPSVIPHYPYQGRERFQHDFEKRFDTFQGENEWILVTGVTPEEYSRVFEPQGENRDSVFSLGRAYDTQLKLLLLRIMASTPHEAASITFDRLLCNATRPLGVTPQPAGGIRSAPKVGSKVPDQAWGLLRKIHGRSGKWPSVVLEVAYSETRAKLRSDVRYWFRASHGEVKIVFTVKIERATPRVTIEKWGVDLHGRGRSHLEQVVNIAKSGATVAVSGAPLLLAYENLFLCPAVNATQNTICIRENELISYAKGIWRAQGLEEIENA